MAVTVKTEPDLEIIEIIDDDGDAFNTRVATQTSHEAGGPRWVGSIVAATLVASIGYGVISSASSSGAHPAHTPPTSVPTTAANSPTTSISQIAARAMIVSPQYYVADPPPQFAMHFAETLGMGGNTVDFINSDPAELWATDHATATTGSWFVVSTGTHHSTGRNSYRVMNDNIEVVVERDPASGQSRLSFTKDGQELEITAFGWGDQQLLKLADTVTVSGSAIRYNAPFFATDHHRVLDADPAAALYGLPVARLGYTTAIPASWAENFTITVAGWPGNDRDVVTRFALTDATTFAVGSESAIIGRLAADPTVSIAQWRDGERLITVRGNISAPRLAAIAQTVHPTSDSAVKQQLATSRLVEQTSDVPAASVGEPPGVQPAGVASGILADGWGWGIQVSPRMPDDPAGGYVWWIGQPGDSGPPEARLSLAAQGPTIETFVERGRTYVVAKVPKSTTGAHLRVSLTGQPSTDVALTDVDAVLPDQFAAFAFVDPVPFTAHIVDGDGATIVAWPAT